MTIPFERTNALKSVREFLYDLCDPKKRPKTVRELRERVLSCTKHYPTDLDIDRLIKKCPDILGKSDSGDY